MVLTGSCASRVSETDLADPAVDALKSYMERFPQSQLRDVYKFCFQDRFGLEHLLTDSLAAACYIENEIAVADSSDWDRQLFHYPLLDSHYVRVDLGYVRQGIVPVSVLVSAMFQSSGEPVTPSDIAEWKQQWHSIMATLEAASLRPLNYEQDSVVIDSLLDAGQYALHHSRLFNDTYRQHYRIVRNDIFKSRILPLIE